MTRPDRRRPPHAERRSQRRVPGAEFPSLSAHLSGGARVALLDVSQGGVRLHTTRHMRPGQRVSVRFSIDERVVTLTACVVRAAVIHVHPEEVRYETGLRLVDDLVTDLLDVALVERRTGEAPVADEPDDAEADDLVFTPMTDPAAADQMQGNGWCLSSARRRSRALDDLFVR